MNRLGLKPIGSLDDKRPHFGLSGHLTLEHNYLILIGK